MPPHISTAVLVSCPTVPRSPDGFQVVSVSPAILAIMTVGEIHGAGGPMPPVQDDLTIEQFILDGQHPTRPQWYGQRPVLIEEATGREIGSDEVSP